MRKLIVGELLSLDGVMQASGGPDEDRRGGFEHGGWQRPYLDDVTASVFTEAIAETGGFLLGRRTYAIRAAFFPNLPEGDPISDAMNGLAKYVASTTLEEPLAWKNSTLLKGDVAEAVAELKRESDDRAQPRRLEDDEHRADDAQLPAGGAMTEVLAPAPEAFVAG